MFQVVVASGEGGILLLRQRLRWWICSGSGGLLLSIWWLLFDSL
jgi:hypothetical protein